MSRLMKMLMVLAIALFGFLPIGANGQASAQSGDEYQQQPDSYQDQGNQDQGNYDQNYGDQNNYGDENGYNDNYSDQNSSDQNGYDNNGNYDERGYNDQYSEPSYDQNDFDSSLNNSGRWVNVSPFGRCWQPNAASGWRPFSDGHWVTTTNGPTWEGNEPWAAATYHYGNWVWTREYGWVWVPGSQYSPGNVSWSYGPDSIGWMPTPPYGYDYSRGYLSYVGPVNQFSYYDSGFGFNFSFGGGYYPAAYQPLFFSPSYVSVCPNLWFFIGRNHFFAPSYAHYYLGPTYTRNVFVQKTVRINSRPVRRDALEHIVGRQLPVVPVHQRPVVINGRRTTFLAPEHRTEPIRQQRIQSRPTAPIRNAIPQERFQNNMRNDFERNLEPRKSETFKPIQKPEFQRPESRRPEFQGFQSQRPETRSPEFLRQEVQKPQFRTIQPETRRPVLPEVSRKEFRFSDPKSVEPSRQVKRDDASPKQERHNNSSNKHRKEKS